MPSLPRDRKFPEDQLWLISWDGCHSGQSKGITKGHTSWRRRLSKRQIFLDKNISEFAYVIITFCDLDLTVCHLGYLTAFHPELCRSLNAFSFQSVSLSNLVAQSVSLWQ